MLARHRFCCLHFTGGTLAVTFWPSQVEDKGPWQRLADLTTNKPKQQAVSSHSPLATVSTHTQLQELATLTALAKALLCSTLLLMTKELQMP